MQTYTPVPAHQGHITPPRLYPVATRHHRHPTPEPATHSPPAHTDPVARARDRSRDHFVGLRRNIDKDYIGELDWYICLFPIKAFI